MWCRATRRPTWFTRAKSRDPIRTWTSHGEHRVSAAETGAALADNVGGGSWAGYRRPSLFTLDVSTAEQAQLGALLSSAELARAERFHAQQHCDRFIVAHGRLRQLLAAQLDVPAAGIELAVGEHGKPRLDGAQAHLGLQFNLSHSGFLGLVGWSWRRAIGVDIEQWRAMHDEAALVRRYFSPYEITAYEALPAAERRQAFFEIWTRKEAFVKAVGRGLALPLDSFDVALGAGTAARLLRVTEPAGGSGWTLAAPELAGEVSLAVVLEGDAFHIQPQR